MNSLGDRKKLIVDYLTALQDLGYDMETGIQVAEALWESITTCKGSPDYIFEMEVAMNNHEVTVFAELLTKLINIENTLLNIIEQYQFYLENSYVIDDTVYSKTNKTGVPIRTARTKDPCMSPNTIRSMPIDFSNGLTQTLLQCLQMNEHIDRVCKCSKVFNSIRRVLMEDEEVVEAEVLHSDIMNITGTLPKVTNHLTMLEKMHGKFKRKLSEYEETIFQINQTFMR
jgi:hypothetical protein